jgi:hypothetical protein
MRWVCWRCVLQAKPGKEREVADFEITPAPSRSERSELSKVGGSLRRMTTGHLRAGPQGVEFGLKVPSPLSSINKAKKNLDSVRQRLLQAIKLFPPAFSQDEHLVRGDSHVFPPSRPTRNWCYVIVCLRARSVIPEFMRALTLGPQLCEATPFQPSVVWYVSVQNK